MSGQNSSSKQSRLATPDTVLFTTEERIELIAQIIVDRIIEDKKQGFKLLKTIEVEYGTTEEA